MSREGIEAYWEQEAPPRSVLNLVRRRLLFDLALEFGLVSRVGRTLERTGSLSARVATDGEPLALAREALRRVSEQTLDETCDEALLTRWVHGVLEHLRHRGAIMHEWLHRYLDEDGNRWAIWGGRRRGQGMPAFPTGRSAPAFPRHGGKPSGREQLLDNILEPTGWYARWTSQVLGITPNHGAALVRQLLDAMTRSGVLESRTSRSGAVMYGIPATHVVVRRLDDQDLARDLLLVCNTCATQWPGDEEIVQHLVGGPCLTTRCHGTLVGQTRNATSFYRHLYAQGDMRRIVAREHTSLLPAAERLAHEQGFKEGGEDPQQPNTIVATPTLEMGIDIGDLSAVFLASLPRTVANYLQRIGRAGRATGNAIVLAYVRGRGEALPRLGDPSSMINGMVRPPAIYLSASEILQRQYLAYLVDRRALREESPRRVAEAMGSVDPGSFLGDLVADAATHHRAHLDRFLGSFAQRLRPDAVEHLRRWATPVAGPLTSPLAELVIQASLDWRHRIEELTHRITTIQERLPDLEQAATVPAASDDDKNAHRMALSALRLTRQQQASLQGEYWIATMEEFGLLPNYTLLGDSTTLDVSISWYNPDSDDYEQEVADFQRPSAQALTEFAPGSTFYARGWEIGIDAIDLGPDAEAIRRWACCPECGFVQDLFEEGLENRIDACPCCAATGIADVGQHLETVELRRASADVRREESRIDDRRDDRQRTRFQVVCVADVDPQNVHTSWFVKDYDFGAKYLTRITLRWLNLGAATGQAAQRTLAGQDVTASLFRVCGSCGHIDQDAGHNTALEHRPWCQHRNSTDEHTRTVALTRTLTTQGVVIPLPYTVTAGDSFAQPSLEAALLMGIRDEFGGSPDHIGVTTIRDPQPEGTSSPALLLHDMVPGGTGYLADLGSPQRLWDLLHTAHRVVRDCPCQHEDRLACHRCLLPFAAPHQLGTISRATAERHLRAILNSGRSDQDGVPDTLDWQITQEQTTRLDPESVLESRFRTAFLDLAQNLGMQVHETPSTSGFGNTIRLTHGRHSWRLEPQVLTHGTQMDFEVTSTSPAVKIAIYLDGYRYHASPLHNRLADDATKRATLRDAGYQVLSITWQDIDTFQQDHQHGCPAWINRSAVPRLLSTFGFTTAVSDAAIAGPMHTLAALLQLHDPAPWAGFARALPTVVPPQRLVQIPPRADLADAAAALLDDERAMEAAEPNGWWWHQGPVGILVHRRPSATPRLDVDVVVILDDRAQAVAREGFQEHWQTWLAISNMLIFRSDATATVITTITRAHQTRPAPAATRAEEASLPSGWAAKVDAAYVSPDLAIELVGLGVREPDLAGHEIGSDNIPVDFVWSRAHVVVMVELDPQTADALAAEGWRVFGPDDPRAIAAAVQEES